MDNIQTKLPKALLRIIGKFRNNGTFTFKTTDGLCSVCNAPKDKNGIYIIQAKINNNIEILYIGSSSKRKEGLRGRILNGKQFNDYRRRSWPKKMSEYNLKEISVCWYDTEKDDARKIESKLLIEATSMMHHLPFWNKEIRVEEKWQDELFHKLNEQ